MTSKHTLQGLLAQPGLIDVPDVYDVLSGRTAERIGFEAVFVGGLHNAAFVYGYPDNGLVTPLEQIAHAGRIASSTGLAVIADIDDGGGSPLRIHRSIRAAGDAGIAAVIIEDIDASQGKNLVTRGLSLDMENDVLPIAKAVENVKAAVAARGEDGPMIIARTDASAWSMEDALDRLGRFADAGADLVFAAHTGIDELEVIVRSASAPVVHAVGVLTPEDRAAVEHAGAKFLLEVGAAAGAAFSATWDALELLKSTHTIAPEAGAAMARAFDLVEGPAWTDRAVAHAMTGAERASRVQ